VTTSDTTTIYEHMFRSFGLKENPFQVSPDPRFLFSGQSYEAALAELMFGIEAHRGLLVLTGEAGTGKTTLMRHFLQWLKSRQFSSSYIFHSHLDPAELFEFILRDFDVPVESTKKTDLLATLHRWLHARQAEGDSPVIVIDEAQALSLRTLSELNLLLNLENVRGKLVQIVLAGQPELEEKLRRPESRALRQRIMVRCRLPLLSLEETQEYIASRLRGAGGSGAQTFPAETVETIYSYARGIPRVVNLLCEQALIGAYADRSPTVSPGNVRRVAAEFDLVGEPFRATHQDFKFAPRFPVSLTTPAQTASGADAPAAAQDRVTAKVPVVERAMAATATTAEAAAPVTQAQAYQAGSAIAETIQPQATSTPTPTLDSILMAEEKPTVLPETPKQEGTGASATSEQLLLNSASVAEQSAPAQAALETPELETVVAAIRTEPEPPAIAEDSVLQEEQFTLHVVPPRGKLQPLYGHAWRKRRAESPFLIYWREVAESFVRDWRAFFASFAPQVSAFAGNVPQRADSIRRKVIGPLRTWLRTPIQNGRARDIDEAPRPGPSDKS
jgi:general secretion pathway protein A